VVLTVQQEEDDKKYLPENEEGEEEYYGESDSQLSDSINKLIAAKKKT
jgi:hypothetical protein